MKTVFTLFLFGGLSLVSYAQEKHEFGFLWRAGNYAIPQQKNLPGYQVGAPHSQLAIRQKAGEFYSMGLWGSVPIWGQFRLSSEFSFNIFRFTHIRNHTTDYPSGSSYVDGRFLERHKMIGYSVSLPVKLHYSFKNNGKWSLSLGAGISHLVSASNHYYGHSQFEGFPESTHNSIIYFSDWDEFESTFSLNAGIHHRIGTNTRVGIEYISEKSASKDLFSYHPDYIFCDCKCGCDGYYSRPRPNINSFSVSLRHNILH